VSSSITGDPHPLAANKGDDALMAWLSLQSERGGDQQEAFDKAQTRKKTSSKAKDIYTDSFDRVFALWASD
jgi:hypothetical protein